ncbi:MAG: ATP-binding cassette domain-containing protein [Ilumatobacteraceae bacterium]
MVHQHFMLIPTMSVAENVALDCARRGVRTDLDVVSDRLEALGASYGLRADPGALVRHLSVGEQQRAEILKALYRDVSVLILDEPTAVLTPQEVDEFFGFLRQMRDRQLDRVHLAQALRGRRDHLEGDRPA